MPSFLCESSPTGQYTSYVPTLRVRVSVAVEPGWMSSVSRSMPCPSTSKACGMLPALVTVKETGPAAIVASDSSTFHSESLEEHTSGLQSRFDLVWRLLPEKKKEHTSELQ